MGLTRASLKDGHLTDRIKQSPFQNLSTATIHKFIETGAAKPGICKGHTIAAADFNENFTFVRTIAECATEAHTTPLSFCCMDVKINGTAVILCRTYVDHMILPVGFDFILAERTTEYVTG
jgi:hypothetical protein